MKERKRRILVVEDEAPLREMIARRLEREGYDVAQASDAEQVLLRMSRDRAPFDLVLTDIHLPGLSGIELLRLLLIHSPLRPVVMITGDSDDGLARTALNYGAAGYLLKPFQLAELESVVQQAVTRLDLVVEVPTDAESPNGAIPIAWIELADRRSDAGRGHGYRVARIAGSLVSAMGIAFDPADRRALDVAARAHELGRLLGPAATPTERVSRTAQLLYDLGVESRVLRVINHMRERWDGGGEPHGIAGAEIPLASRMMAVADAVDHAAVARLNAGMDPAVAVEEAIREVRVDAEERYGPDVAGAFDTAGGVVEAIWVLARGPSDSMSIPAGSK